MTGELTIMLSINRWEAENLWIVGTVWSRHSQRRCKWTEDLDQCHYRELMCLSRNHLSLPYDNLRYRKRALWCVSVPMMYLIWKTWYYWNRAEFLSWHIRVVKQRKEKKKHNEGLIIASTHSHSIIRQNLHPFISVSWRDVRVDQTIFTSSMCSPYCSITLLEWRSLQ